MTPEIAAEAAVWVARLHGPDRSVHMERECLAWQARSAAHRLAFERCTDTWQDVAGLRLSTYANAASAGAASDAKRAGPFKPRRWALAATALAVGGVLVLQPWRAIDTYVTGVGEQRLVILQDGTRMSLNTATHVRVELARAQRTVKVDGGEALFEVAKDARRPFVVQAAGTEVVATGTAFVVRLTPASKGGGDALAVTLVEGQIVVRAADRATDAVLLNPVVMAVGDRVRLRRLGGVAPGESREAMQVDRPRMDQMLAWKRGEAIFDDVSLLDAVAEMNRYSPKLIMVTGSDALRDLRVSGVFRTGDNVNFARAVAELHGLAVRERSDRLELGLR
ncbi:MAG: FecR domain-containing protein [Paucibacter sp.]|nr:FecR domain-containing protein [Roseateles sp.]